MADKKNGVLDSFLDAFRGWNLFLKFIMFVAFGVVTATPHLIKNLDQVGQKAVESGATGAGLIIPYLIALVGATKEGFLLGLSTVYSTLTNFPALLSAKAFGTIGFSLIVLIFATATIFQPVRLIFNAIDMKKGREHSRSTILLFSLVLTLVVLTPLSSLLVEGKTITTDIKFEEPIVPKNESLNETENPTPVIDLTQTYTGS